MAIIQTTAEFSFTYKRFTSLKKWLKLVIENESFITGDITIVFTSDEYLASVNRKYLQHDYFTDVITFNYSSNKVLHGDILVSVERVMENSEIFNVDTYVELDRVILHGVLHLIGYNDSNDLEISYMREKENFYLAKR